MSSTGAFLLSHLALLRVRIFAFACCWLQVSVVCAQPAGPRPLPEPLGIGDVVAYAGQHRQEIAAARALARASTQRGEIVSSLEDPMLMPSVDHLPFMLHGVDASLMVEQRFPLSGVLGERRRVADADARRLLARTSVVQQDVQLEAARAFFMLRERRAMAHVLAAQLELARDFVAAASGRYASGTGSQTDLLRAEVEVARFEGALKASVAAIAAAEAMLNASLGRAVHSAVPPLRDGLWKGDPSSWGDVRHTALIRRSELDAGRADVERADAETAVMRSMGSPMGFVRTGPSYTMADGWGWMVMFGVSVPIWRDKYDAGVSEARAMAEMARADLAAMKLMIEGEAATARLEVVAARSRVSALNDNVLPRAKQAIAPAVAGYASGTAPLVSVLDAAQALWSIESELVMAEAELGMAWVRLMRAQGQFDIGGGK